VQKELTKIAASDPGDLGANPALQQPAPEKSASDQLNDLVQAKIKEQKLSYRDAMIQAQQDRPDLARKIADEMAGAREKKGGK
jgi:hypothetical protein